MTPPLTTGDAWPMPTVTFQRGFNSFGQAEGAAAPVPSPSRFGPRHCGHSAAATAGAPAFASVPTAAVVAPSAAAAGVGVAAAGAGATASGVGVGAASPTS